MTESHRFRPIRHFAGMIFRATQTAWTTRDLADLRDRLTPEIHGALQAQCDRLRSERRVNHIEHVEITGKPLSSRTQNPHSVFAGPSILLIDLAELAFFEPPQVFGCVDLIEEGRLRRYGHLILRTKY